MNLGGVKTLPAMYENAALEHELVRDAALFAIPGDKGVDEPWLAIVAEEGLTREALDEHLKARRRRLPALRIAWTDAIPRNAMGKIDRQALRAQTEAALKPK
jgi:acyl-CoA synthetase (AMP-forming)/AMP-acid ligase II